MLQLSSCLPLLLLLLGSASANIKRDENLPPVDKYGCKEVCNADFDVVFIIDKSGSISSQEYAKFEQGMKLLVNAFTVSLDRSHIGAVYFSTNSSLGFLLDEHDNAVDVKSDLTVLTGGFTNIASGLREARLTILEGSENNLSTTLKGDRPNIPNLCFLFSDGIHNREVDNTIPQADLLKRICTVISVGIGLTDPAKQLLQLISSDDKAYFVSSFNELEEDVKHIIALACPTDDPPTDCTTKDIGKSTFNYGNNEDWFVELSSENPAHELKKTLARMSWCPDPRDDFGGFDVGDSDQTFRLKFRAQENCTYQLNYLKGQLISHTSSQTVKVVAYDENGDVITNPQWSLLVPNIGQYQDFMISFPFETVSQVEFQFPDPCTSLPCSGINAVQGEYTKCCLVDVDCSDLCCYNGGTPGPASDGCCQCFCPDGFAGSFCEVVLKTKVITKKTYFDGNNKNWNVITSSVETGHEPRKSLARSFLWNVDPFDNYFSFSSSDTEPKYTIQFNPDGSYKIHYLRGQINTPFAGQEVTVTAYDKENIVVGTQTYTTIDTGPRGYQNFSLDFEVNGEPQTVERIEVTFNRACDTHPCLGLNDIFGRYTVLEPAKPDCCCENGGTPDLGEYGCCQCCCPEGFSGNFCEYASKTKEVNLWTFKGGNNKEWLVELSSEHQDHPLRETLMVKNLPSGSYDENGAFDAGDSQTTYNLIFRGKHTYELHYIEAQFQTAASGEKVEVTAFNGNDEVESWEVPLSSVGPTEYQNWSLNVGSLEATRLQLNFSASCETFPCLGINAFYANYTRHKKVSLDCCCQNGGTPTLDKNGCCSCACRRKYTGEFCEKTTRDQVISRWTYKGGSNPDFNISMSSRHNDRPLHRSLKRKPIWPTWTYDRSANFDSTDSCPKYTIEFCPGCVYKFNSLEGEFSSPNGGEIATWSAYDCQGNLIMDWDTILQGTGPTEYQFFSIDMYGIEVCKMELTLSFNCNCYPCFGINALFGEYTRICEVPIDCCCENGGTPYLDKNGCCKCNCPDNTMGDSCETVCQNKELAKWTYPNKRWSVSMSTEHPKYSIRKSLIRSFKHNQDPYDRYATFIQGDSAPLYTMQFTPGASYFMQWLKGQFYTSQSGRSAYIKVFGPTNQQWTIGLTALQAKQYQDWSIPINQEVTKIEISFSHPCDCYSCYGINALHGGYQVCTTEPVGCCCENGGTATLTSNGCCECQCPDGFSGEFCEQQCKRRKIAKWTFRAPWHNEWDAEISTEDNDYPIRKTLRRSFNANNDPFDQCGGFAPNDPDTYYNIVFNDDAEYQLHFLEGQFATKSAGKEVVVSAFKGAALINSWTIQLVQTGHQQYQNWSIPDIDEVVTKVKFDYSDVCDSDRCFCINDLYGEYTRCKEDTPDCCCLNGGTASLNENGCCQCECPDHYSGDFCQTHTKKKVIAKYTYSRGNKHWYLTMSTTYRKNPTRKALRRKHPKGFDNYAGFKIGDQNPQLSLTFRGDGKKKLHFLEGQFRTSLSNQNVTVTVNNGNNVVFTKVINLVGGSKYQDWYINFNDIVATNVVFTFSSPCTCRGCFGINDMYGQFTRCYDTPLNCDHVDCGPKMTAEFNHGCCKCVDSPPQVCSEKLDVALIIDRSGSIGRHYPTLKQFLKDVIGRFNIDSSTAGAGARFGAVLYNKTAELGFYLNDHMDFSDYQSAVNAFPGPGGKTNIAGALELTNNEILQESRGDRPQVSNVCLLITDARPNVREDETEAQANLLRNKCTLMTIGIGNNINSTLLTDISTGGLYFPVEDFDQLENELDNLVTVVCNSSP